MAEKRPPAATVSERSWTITGASAETRELVREAAAKDGLTIRAWVDKTLNAAAKASLDGPSPTSAEPAGSGADIDAAMLGELSAKMDLILGRLGADAPGASASLQTPLAAVYERFLTRTAEVFDELGETSRRLADAAAEAETEAARAAAGTPPAAKKSAAKPAAKKPAPKRKPKTKPKPGGKPGVQAKPKATVRAKPPQKVRGKHRKRPTP